MDRQLVNPYLQTSLGTPTSGTGQLLPFQHGPPSPHPPPLHYPHTLTHPQIIRPSHPVDPRHYPNSATFRAPDGASPWHPNRDPRLLPSVRPSYQPGGHQLYPPIGSLHGSPFISPTGIREEVNPQSAPVTLLPLMGLGFRPMGIQPQVISGPRFPVGLQGPRVPSSPQASVSLTESDPFINDWLKIVGAKRSKVKEREQKEHQHRIKIPDVRCLLSQASHLLFTLRSFHSQLSTLPEADTASWGAITSQVQQCKSELLAITTKLDSPGAVDHLVKRVGRTRARRMRIKRRREAREAEKNEKMLLAEQATDNWLQTKRQEELRLKTEEAVQCSAKGVLGEVKKKQNEIQQFRSLLTALRNLREHRKENKKRGDVLPPDTDEKFHKKAEVLDDLLSQQCQLYEEEEHTLRVLMKEEVKEKMNSQQRKSYNPHDPAPPDVPPTPTDPLGPYREYWLQAERSIEAKAAIRNNWSCFEHPEGSSFPFDSDTLPSHSSNPLWNQYRTDTN